MLNYLANCELTEEGPFGKEPYSRADPPPMVGYLSFFSIFFVAEFCLSNLTNRPLNRAPSSSRPAAGTAGPERQFLPDGAKSVMDDPDLGAAALEDDTEGGGGEAGGSRLGASLEDWPDDDAGEVAPRPAPPARARPTRRELICRAGCPRWREETQGRAEPVRQ